MMNELGRSNKLYTTVCKIISRPLKLKSENGKQSAVAVRKTGRAKKSSSQKTAAWKRSSGKNAQYVQEDATFTFAY